MDKEKKTIIETIRERFQKARKKFSSLTKGKKTVLISLVLALILFLLGFQLRGAFSCHIPPGQRGVVYRRFSHNEAGQILGEGTHFMLPELQTVYNIRVHRQSASIERITADSREFQDAALWLNVEFQLQEENLLDFFETYGVKSSTEIINSIIIPNANEVTKNIIINYRISDILPNQPTIKAEISGGLRSVLEPYFIEVIDVDIENIRLDPEFRDLIAEVEFAEYEKQRENLQLEIARRNAEIRILEAETLKREMIIQAEAEAEYNRELNRQSITAAMLEYKRLENARLAIEKWNGEFPGETGTISDWPF